MTRIFLNYRREDASAETLLLYQALSRRYGEQAVFMDIHAIKPGKDFEQAIEKALDQTAVMLVVIGDRWLNAQDDRGRRRLDDGEDFVRMEAAHALARPDVRVIPILVKGARMPHHDELPHNLRKLARRNAIEVRHGRWNADVDALEAILNSILDSPLPPESVLSLPIAPRQENASRVRVLSRNISRPMMGTVRLVVTVHTISEHTIAFEAAPAFFGINVRLIIDDTLLVNTKLISAKLLGLSWTFPFTLDGIDGSARAEPRLIYMTYNIYLGGKCLTGS